ncbi:MAG: hypothetical protein BWX88_03619 [Planctomycetes bacterium ADurb.Bin126]|nr:MAG: hypothetical protein BWX88_03619 [Planctomycetes bacterium ADurb.Bin126]
MIWPPLMELLTLGVSASGEAMLAKAEVAPTATLKPTASVSPTASEVAVPACVATTAIVPPACITRSSSSPV